MPFRKISRATSSEDAETWGESELGNTLNTFDASETRSSNLVVEGEIQVFENHGQDSRYTGPLDVGEAINAKYGTGGNNQPFVVKDLCLCDQGKCIGFDGYNGSETDDAHYGLGCGARGGVERELLAAPDEPRSVDFQNFREQSVNGSLQATSCHNTASNNVVRHNYVVRRLMPIEAERLQGFKDNWTDIGDWEDTKGKKHKTTDSARYKALGNSICLPGWKWILKRISAQYERDATMGSLFDGIGGFPYLWEQINGKGMALWASEIDEFCIAVTKKRIGED